jgi:Co/Zn/Cd efflux system component
LAAVLAGIGIWYLGWSWLDPATALLISVVIAISAWALLRDSFEAAMDAVPRGIDRDAVQAFLAARPGVTTVHHLHIWALGAGEIAMTAHLVRPEAADHDAFIDALVHDLDHEFGINHPTVQIERSGDCGA